MSVSWSDLGAAFALYLVLEGIFPFVSPEGLKRRLLAMAQLENRSLRIYGLVSMVVGLGLLQFIHS
jgi:uncharacterized protein YjeT (DUF2065 family)